MTVHVEHMPSDVAADVLAQGADFQAALVVKLGGVQ